jgi:hypothetical protein
MPRPLRFLAPVLIAVIGAVSSQAATPAHFWSQRFGSTSGDVGNAVATDAAGNIYVTGFFNGIVNFGGSPLTSAGSNDVFIAKYNANGAHQWSQRFGSVGDDLAYGIAVDASANVFVTGYFSGTVNFGGIPLASAGSTDIFIAKYNASGVHQWSNRFGSTGPDYGVALATDAAGNVAVTGNFQGTVNFGGSPLTSAGFDDIFIAVYNSGGGQQWSRGFGSTAYDYGNGVAADAVGNVVLTGLFQLTVDFGGGPLVAVAGDAVVAKYDNTGVHQWSQRYGGFSTDSGRDVALDASGSVYITGLFYDTANFGGTSLVSAGGSDVVIAKYTPGGTHVWSQRFGGTLNDAGNDIAADGAGNVVVTGYFLNTADFGGGPLTSAGIEDIYIASYDANGTHRWSQRYGSTGYDVGIELALGLSRGVIVAGWFDGTVDLGGGPLTSAGSSDIFLAQYGSEPAEPQVASITDVGNDQGKQVKISFARSGYDATSSTRSIVQYEAFRRDAALPAAFATDSGPEPLTDWVFAGAVPAHGEDDYQILVPTLADSTITHGMYRTTFFIRAASASPLVFHDSPPDSGYSVDNLAPSVPQGFVYTAGVLTWLPSKDADFDYASVYGSSSPVFNSSAILIDYTTETTLDVSSTSHVYYYVTATDFSGNEGKPARVSTLSGVERPTAFTLAINAYPNPFNPHTTIRFDVPAHGRSVVSVYDARGSLVATLVDRLYEPGSYSVSWEGKDDHGAPAGSGVYFARLAFEGQTRSRKLVLLK